MINTNHQLHRDGEHNPPSAETGTVTTAHVRNLINRSRICIDQQFKQVRSRPTYRLGDNLIRNTMKLGNQESLLKSNTNLILNSCCVTCDIKFWSKLYFFDFFFNIYSWIHDVPILSRLPNECTNVLIAQGRVWFLESQICTCWI